VEKQKNNANLNFFTGISGVGWNSWYWMGYNIGLFLPCVCWPW